MLLIIGTRPLRNIKGLSGDSSIFDDGQLVKVTQSEKLLRVVINNTLTWKEHLYGEKWRENNKSSGLIPQLTQCRGLLKKIGKLALKQKLRTLAGGLFFLFQTCILSTSVLKYLGIGILQGWRIKEFEFHKRG